jgi:hypothetical protein
MNSVQLGGAFRARGGLEGEDPRNQEEGKSTECVKQVKVSPYLFSGKREGFKVQHSTYKEIPNLFYT